jgi:flagellar biosynthetic protein FliQ
MGTFDTLLRQALMTCALLAFPVLGAATLVGTLVAIGQAATQIQEQTLTLLPKILVVAALLLLFGHAGFALLGGMLVEAVRAMPSLARAVT